jgi:hypothetical protein
VSAAGLRVLCGLMAFTHLALGVLMAVAPSTFFDAIGPYGTLNDHYIRDLSTFYLALGAAFGVSALRPSWRVPVIALALVQYALHTVNHLIDIGDADPSALGPVNAVSLALGGGLLAWMLTSAARQEARP